MHLRLISAITLLFVTAQSAIADRIPVPSGDVILTVTGDITQPNVGDTLQFDLETFSSLGATTIQTQTIWTNGVDTFEGVPLHVLTALFGVDDGILRSTAINDYSVDIPTSDAIKGGPIIAFAMNGAPISIRDKGPLWVIYPFDSASKYRTQVIYSRSIWHLDRMTILSADQATKP